MEEEIEEKKTKRKGHKKTGLILSIWLFCLLAVFVVFVIKIDSIKSNLKSTKFFERIFGSTPTFITEYHEKVDSKPKDGDVVINLKSDAGNGEEISSESYDKVYDLNALKEIVDAVGNETPESVQADETGENQEVQEAQVNTAESSEDKQEEVESSENSESAETVIPEDAKEASRETVLAQVNAPESSEIVATMSAKLCFAEVDGDGAVIRREILRKVAKSKSPLTNNIKLLLEGPNYTESQNGCSTMIPEGSKLLSASIKEGIAYLNFSKDFEFNRLGIEGYQTQLMQIVYTATEFSTVNAVQFLIDGEHKQYLGSEGVWIGTPLSRASFK